MKFNQIKKTLQILGVSTLSTLPFLPIVSNLMVDKNINRSLQLTNQVYFNSNVITIDDYNQDEDGLLTTVIQARNLMSDDIIQLPVELNDENKTFNYAQVLKWDSSSEHTNWKMNHLSEMEKTSLYKLVLPNEIYYNASTYTLHNINDDAFRGTSGYSHIVIPGSINAIGSHAFTNALELQYVYFDYSGEYGNFMPGKLDGTTFNNVVNDGSSSTLANDNYVMFFIGSGPTDDNIPIPIRNNYQVAQEIYNESSNSNLIASNITTKSLGWLNKKISTNASQQPEEVQLFNNIYTLMGSNQYKIVSHNPVFSYNGSGSETIYAFTTETDWRVLPNWSKSSFINELAFETLDGSEFSANATSWFSTVINSYKTGQFKVAQEENNIIKFNLYTNFSNAQFFDDAIGIYKANIGSSFAYTIPNYRSSEEQISFKIIDNSTECQVLKPDVQFTNIKNHHTSLSIPYDKNNFANVINKALEGIDLNVDIINLEFKNNADYQTTFSYEIANTAINPSYFDASIIVVKEKINPDGSKTYYLNISDDNAEEIAKLASVGSTMSFRIIPTMSAGDNYLTNKIGKEATITIHLTAYQSFVWLYATIGVVAGLSIIAIISWYLRKQYIINNDEFRKEPKKKPINKNKAKLNKQPTKLEPVTSKQVAKKPSKAKANNFTENINKMFTSVKSWFAGSKTKVETKSTKKSSGIKKTNNNKSKLKKQPVKNHFENLDFDPNNKRKGK